MLRTSHPSQEAVTLQNLTLEAKSQFSNALCEQMLRTGIRQVDLAQRIHVDPSTITHWRKQRRIPQDSATVYLVAKALDLNSGEQTELLNAWLASKHVHELEPYIEFARQDGQSVDAVVSRLVDRLTAYLRKEEVQAKAA